MKIRATVTLEASFNKYGSVVLTMNGQEIWHENVEEQTEEALYEALSYHGFDEAPWEKTDA
jgi:hypothetical protein